MIAPTTSVAEHTRERAAPHIQSWEARIVENTAGLTPTSTGRYALEGRTLDFGGRLPIVVGVTGHRDLAPDALPAIVQRVRELLLDYKRRYPATPILIISALAEGADRLIAQVALEPAIGAQVLAPIPLPYEQYLATFDNDQSRNEFLSLTKLDGVVPFTLTEPAVTPEDAFMNLASFLGRNADVVIAVWDGKDARGKGGTADVISVVLGNNDATTISTASQVDPLMVSPVFHVFAPRQGLIGGEVSARWLFPELSEYHSDAEALAYFHRLLEPLDAFNVESMVAGRETNPSDVIGDLFQRADRLAVAYRRRTYRVLSFLSVLVGLAAFAVDGGKSLFVALGGEGAAFLGMLLYPALMALAFLIYRRSRRHHDQDRFQDYRALAEGLRIQRFWQIAGIPFSISRFYLGKQRTELFWIRRACQTARLLAGRAPAAPSRESLVSVLEGWAREQLRYFRETAEREHRRSHLLHATSLSLFWSGLAVAAFLGVIGSAPVRGLLAHAHWAEVLLEEHSTGHHAALLYIIMSAVLAALFHNYSEKTATKEHARQFARMERLFSHGCRDIEEKLALGALDQAQAEIFRLGREALAENGDWLIIHRERPVEVPHH